MTGLQASDLVKPKAKRRETKERPSTFRSPKQQQHLPSTQTTIAAAAVDQSPVVYGQATDQVYLDQTSTSNGTAAGGGGSFQGGGNAGGGNDMSGTTVTLPHFSQVWSGQEVYNQQLLAQINMAAAAADQSMYTANQATMDTNTGALLTIEPDDRIQMAALYRLVVY